MQAAQKKAEATHYFGKVIGAFAYKSLVILFYFVERNVREYFTLIGYEKRTK